MACDGGDSRGTGCEDGIVVVRSYGTLGPREISDTRVLGSGYDHPGIANPGNFVCLDLTVLAAAAVDRSAGPAIAACIPSRRASACCARSSVTERDDIALAAAYPRESERESEDRYGCGQSFHPDNVTILTMISGRRTAPFCGGGGKPLGTPCRIAGDLITRS